MRENSLGLATLREKPSLARMGTAGERRDTAPDLVSDEEDECPAFGFLRGIRDRALSLELRFANGNSQAFPYSWLGPVKYDPSAGLLLKFVGDLVYLVLLEGSNLNALVKGAISLYDRGIQRNRVTWCREMTRLEVEKSGNGEVTIERIRLTSHRADEEPPGVEWLKPFADRQ